MKITYTGRQVELTPAERKKLEAEFAKIGKLLDGKEEREAHVVLRQERHLHHAEVTINYYGHQLVGLGSNGDLFTAIHGASDKLQKQVVKARTKWRDTKRAPRQALPEPPPEALPPARRRRTVDIPGRVHKINDHEKRKPMSLDEALHAMDKTRDYMVYRDADTDRVRVLVRRRDGDFDLVES
jgi:putative sigma-54 modulation protein